MEEEEEEEEEKEEGVWGFRMESLEGQAVGLRGPHLGFRSNAQVP